MQTRFFPRILAWQHESNAHNPPPPDRVPADVLPLHSQSCEDRKILHASSIFLFMVGCASRQEVVEGESPGRHFEMVSSVWKYLAFFHSTYRADDLATTAVFAAILAKMHKLVELVFTKVTQANESSKFFYRIKIFETRGYIFLNEMRRCVLAGFTYLDKHVVCFVVFELIYICLVQACPTQMAY